VTSAPPVRRLVLPDGRTLAHRAYGPQDGAPLLFVPGAASGSRMRFGEELLKGRGLQLLSVDRPGLGFSDADGDKSLPSVGDDQSFEPIFVRGALGRPLEWTGAIPPALEARVDRGLAPGSSLRALLERPELCA